MNDMVTIQNGEARTTSLVIAEGTGTEHASIIKLVRSYHGDLSEFGFCRFEIAKAAGSGRPTEYATMNEPQATLLMTYMKNTPVVRHFKKNLVRAFYEMKGQCDYAYLLEEINIIKDRLIPIFAMGGSAEQYMEIETFRLLHTTKKKGGGEMVMDLEATKEKIKASGRTFTGWARAHGMDGMVAHSKFRGQVKFKPDEIEALRSDGLLVEKEAEAA